MDPTRDADRPDADRPGADRDAALLGALLETPELIDSLAHELVPGQFHEPLHARIFRALVSLRRRGDPVTRASLAEELHDASALAALVPGERRVGEVRALLFARRGSRAPGPAVAAPALVDEALAYLDRLRGGNARGLHYGFVDLDELTLGLHPGDLVAIGARPSIGSTTFLLNVVRHLCLGGPDRSARSVALFSFEHPRVEIATWLLAAMAEVDRAALRGGYLSRADEDRLLDACDPLSKSALVVDDTPALDVDELGVRLRRLREEQGIDVAFVDYVELVTGSELPCRLRALARELEIPIVVTAKLSRHGEDREDRRPRAQDLARVMGLERQADVVLLLHRAEYYLTPEEAYEKGVTNRLEVVVGKNRHGPTGAVELEFRRTTGWIGDLPR